MRSQAVPATTRSEAGGTSSGYDAIDGGPATDTLLGTAGDDVLGVSSLTNVEIIDGGDGFDVLQLASDGRTIDLSATTLTRIERIVGGSGNDTIVGSSGNDVIAGGSGSDTLNGGPGTDTVVYARAYANYSVGATGSGLQVRDLTGNDGVDALGSIERIEFADGVYANGGFTGTGSNNHAPSAANDSASLAEDTSIQVAVLANDDDVDGDVLTVSIVFGAQRTAAASVTTTRTINYTPAADYSGSDSLRYSIADGHGGTASATVTLQVTAVADAPRRARRYSVGRVSVPSISTCSRTTATRTAVRSPCSSAGTAPTVRRPCWRPVACATRPRLATAGPISSPTRSPIRPVAPTAPRSSSPCRAAPRTRCLPRCRRRRPDHGCASTRTSFRTSGLPSISVPAPRAT